MQATAATAGGFIVDGIFFCYFPLSNVLRVRNDEMLWKTLDHRQYHNESHTWVSHLCNVFVCGLCSLNDFCKVRLHLYMERHKKRVRVCECILQVPGKSFHLSNLCCVKRAIVKLIMYILLYYYEAFKFIWKRRCQQRLHPFRASSIIVCTHLLVCQICYFHC